MRTDRRANFQKNRLPPFVPLLIATLESPAWRAMSHGAQMLYVGLKRRYSVNNHNNGRLFLSQRTAAAELRSHHNQIARWFRELQHYGFIVMTRGGSLGLEGKGKAPHWRLTELGYQKDPPTRDFFRWNGQKFRDVKLQSRAAKPAQGVRDMRHTAVRENRPSSAASVQEMAHISDSVCVRGNRHITKLPYTSPQLPNQSVQAVASARTRRVRPRLPPDHKPRLPDTDLEIPTPKRPRPRLSQ